MTNGDSWNVFDYLMGVQDTRSKAECSIGDTVTLPDGRKFWLFDSLSCGDYGGAGVVGESNIRSLEKQFKGRVQQADMGKFERGRDEVSDDVVLIVTYGYYSSKQAWLLVSEETEDLINGLCNYPVVDEDDESSLELDREYEDFDSWIRADLTRAVRDVETGYDETLGDLIDRLDEAGLTTEKRREIFWLVYRRAMEQKNEYPVFEYTGVYVRIEKIQDAFADLLADAIREALSD